MSMERKQSFVMYKNWAGMIKGMPDDQAGKLIKAICRYQTGEDPSVDDPMMAAVLSMIIEKMDEDAKAYDDEIKRRSAAGRIGAQKRWEGMARDGKGMRSHPEAYDDMAKMADTDTVTDTVTDKTLKDKNPRELSLPTDSTSLPGEKERDGQAVSHPAPKKPEDVRHRKGEYGHVMLTDKQLADLIRKHGEPETAAAIEAVDAYCEESGKTYHNYALVVERWGYDAARKGKNRKDGPPARDEPMSGNEFLLSMIREGGDGHADHD